ncbi:CCA tRNA nucleotidyltransferase [Peptostreptococcus anaerobius]|uniref:CCA tRNA nucleotidyltransferase n=1 Tax=Peptostreptococcus anaerobius TaxID=1261 RepID=UPI00254C0368|nr:[cytidine(C)-cytidine(C)-adenosine (A)]-adding enzyme [Peptostreptococcus anaerobius]MDK8277280.1 [cytidine(C)-cytidine(C)-adenosine (A)]-adding enzyme [Peptostreptococcus anaerobius]
MIDKGAALILDKIEECGFEAFVVGGCVRDSIMARTPKDWDITTDALPEDIIAMFDRTIPTGIKHGTVTVLVGGQAYEVTTYRIDGDYLDSRRPESVEFTRNIVDDLSRRDFTINAMAYSPSRGLVDRFSGLEDIKNKIIRCVGNPDLRFKEDALRVMRAIRFSAQLGFQIEESTQKYIEENSLRLHLISAERIHDELEKIIESDPNKVKNLNNLGGFVDKFFLGYRPSDENIGLSTKIDHLYEIFGDKFIEVNFGNIDNLLLQDIKRAYLFLDMEGQVLEETMRVLRYSKKDIDKSLAIHRFLNDSSLEYLFEKDGFAHGERDLRIGLKRIMSRFGDLSLAKNAILAKIIQKNLKADVYFRVYNDIIESGECFSISQMKIDGRFIVENNLAKGPMIGNLLNEMLEHVIKNPSDNEKDRLIEILKNIY